LPNTRADRRDPRWVVCGRTDWRRTATGLGQRPDDGLNLVQDLARANERLHLRVVDVERTVLVEVRDMPPDHPARRPDTVPEGEVPEVERQ